MIQKLNVSRPDNKEESSESVLSTPNTSIGQSVNSVHSSTISPIEYFSPIPENYDEFLYYGTMKIPRSHSYIKLCQILFDYGLNSYNETASLANVNTEYVVDSAKASLRINNDSLLVKNIEFMINKQDSFLALICNDEDNLEETYECFMLKTQNFEQMDNLVSKILAINENCGKKFLGNNVELVIDMQVQVKEPDEGILLSSSNWSSCPIVGNSKTFKVRRNRKKIFIFTLKSALPARRYFRISRCLDVQFSMGTTFSHGQTDSLELVSTIYHKDGRISLLYEAEIEKMQYIFGSNCNKEIQIPLVIKAEFAVSFLNEPLKLAFEFNIRLFPQSEKFLFYRNKSVNEKYKTTLLRDYQSESVHKMSDNVGYVVGEMMYHTSLSENAFSLIDLYRNGEEIRECEETLIDFDGVTSGSGKVVRQINNDELFENWGKLLKKWTETTWPISSKVKKSLNQLCWRGIPDTMRCVVWQRLVGIDNEQVLSEAYRHLITKTSPYENIILRDIGRTYPGHRLFAESSSGQTSLFNVTKAYSIYDEEVGYCQGTSFLAAALLLHMPEEQAFVVFSNIMKRFSFRDLFINDFKGLEILQWQFGRIMQDRLPELHTHFKNIGLHTSMYTSQWFLTLFTAKFPLNMVFRIIDVILCKGVDYVLNISLALLQQSQEDLLKLDFEKIFNYFRVEVAKQFNSDSSCTALLTLSEEFKITQKTLNRLKVEYETMRTSQNDSDPLYRYKKEIADLRRENMRLECECELITEEFINHQFKYRLEVDEFEKQLYQMSQSNSVMRDFISKNKLDSELVKEEVSDLKENYRKQLEEYQIERSDMKRQIERYQSQLVEQYAISDNYKTYKESMMEFVEETLKSCEKCSEDYEKYKFEDKVVSHTIGNEIFDKIKNLEIELANTKLALVEAQCLNESLEHQLQATLVENLKISFSNSQKR